MSKSGGGRFFEDFRLGETIVHATPRTVTAGDQALYIALTGSRFALNCADSFARGLGLPAAPVDDWLVFHLVFGKSVPDVSLNAVANLGYAEGVFGAPVYPGDTLSARSTVVGLKESSGPTGVVYVHTEGVNQRGETVLAYKRWVLVNRRDPGAGSGVAEVPSLAEAVRPSAIALPTGFSVRAWDFVAAGSPHAWEDYAPGERIDHLDGMTLEEAEHQMATRLYQNTARVHFDQRAAAGNRFGRRIVYGGHVISLARALSFNGLGGAFRIAALNAGRHVSPTFAGHTIYAWSEVLESAAVQGRDDVGLLRLRTIATKDRPCADFPDKGADGKPDPSVVLDLDYWALLPRRP